jgi:hypothetical protein
MLEWRNNYLHYKVAGPRVVLELETADNEADSGQDSKKMGEDSKGETLIK